MKIIFLKSKKEYISQSYQLVYPYVYYNKSIYNKSCMLYRI